MTDENLSTEEKELLYKYLSDSESVPTQEAKYTVHVFLHRVATANDTTKVGYLKDEEVGTPRHPTRALKSFALIASDIIKNDVISNYFNKESEIVTSTSLSRDGFLVKQAVTQTRQIADVTKQRQKNSGWFKKKDENSEDKE